MVIAALAMGVLGAQLLQSMGTASSGALAQLQSYTDVLLPALSMATASCGGFTAAATLQAGTVAFLALLCRLILHLLQPLALVYLALACAEAAMGDETLAKLRGLVGWVIGASLKTVLFPAPVRPASVTCSPCLTVMEKSFKTCFSP